MNANISLNSTWIYVFFTCYGQKPTVYLSKPFLMIVFQCHVVSPVFRAKCQGASLKDVSYDLFQGCLPQAVSGISSAVSASKIFSTASLEDVSYGLSQERLPQALSGMCFTVGLKDVSYSKLQRCLQPSVSRMSPTVHFKDFFHRQSHGYIFYCQSQGFLLSQLQGCL